MKHFWTVYLRNFIEKLIHSSRYTSMTNKLQNSGLAAQLVPTKTNKDFCNDFRNSQVIIKYYSELQSLKTSTEQLQNCETKTHKRL